MKVVFFPITRKNVSECSSRVLPGCESSETVHQVYRFFGIH